MPTGTYAVPLERLTDHRILLSVTGQTYLSRILVIDTEQAGLRVEHDPLAGEETAQMATQGKVFGRTGRNPVRPVHQPNLVGDLERQFEVVCGEENRLICASCQMVEQLHDLHLTRKIEESGRLVQKDNRCFLSQRLGDHDLLPFSVREGMHHAGGQVLDPYQSDRFFYDLLVLLAQPPPKPV